MANKLFADLPKDLTKLADGELADLLERYGKAAELIDSEDPEFLKDLSADEIIAAYKEGALAIMAMREEQAKRVEDAERFKAEKAEIAASLVVKAEEDAASDEENGDEENGDGEEEAPAEEATEPEAEAEVEDPVKEKVAVTASADEMVEEPVEEKRPMRRAVPAPAADRIVVTEEETKALSFVASASVKGTPAGHPFATEREIAEAMEKVMRQVKVNKSAHGVEEQVVVASLDWSERYPDSRFLRKNDIGGNGEKVAAIHELFAGSTEAARSLVASGGLCAPLEPIYTIPNPAVRDRPVRDGLPGFRAERGGINVPTPGTIADVGGAITVITESEDALGGTFATKHCLDFDCPTYTETAVTVISHCREFGNLVAMSWPEFIQNQNDLTMAGHARIAEQYLLDRIKAQSLNVTTGLDTLGALIYVVNAVKEAAFGIRSRLRMSNDARFDVYFPRVLLDLLMVDTVSTQFDRYRTQGDIEAYLDSLGIDVYWYMDSPSSGTSQIADTSQDTGSGLEGFPANIQFALHPRGTFLHLDMAELNLGIVRDSTLNSTNDFQIFGEVFENVARIGPLQAAYWITANLCPTGQFPATGTARLCE